MADSKDNSFASTQLPMEDNPLFSDELNERPEIENLSRTSRSSARSTRNSEAVALSKKNEQSIQELTDLFRMKIEQDAMDKQEQRNQLQEIRLLLSEKPASNVEGPEIDDWALLRSRIIGTDKENTKPSVKNSKVSDSGRRDSALRKELNRHHADAQALASSANTLITIQNNFTHRKFNLTNEFTYASFLELVSALKSFMAGRDDSERIGPYNLLSEQYFSQNVRTAIATKLNDTRDLYLININTVFPSNQKKMFELPDFFLDETETIDIHFLHKLNWVDALAWLELFFKATDRYSFKKFYRDAVKHIRNNLIQTKIVSITSVNYIVTDIKTANAYYRQCLSINPQRHSSSMDTVKDRDGKLGKFVSVGAFPGMKDIGGENRSEGMISVLLSYLPPKLKEDLVDSIRNEEPHKKETMEQILEIVEQLMTITSKCFSGSASRFIAIVNEKPDYKWSVINQNKTFSGAPIGKSNSSVRTQKVNNLEEDQEQLEDEEHRGPNTIISELTREQKQVTSHDEAASTHSKNSGDDPAEIEAINALLQGMNKGKTDDKNTMGNYCTRAMFAHLKGNQKCSNANCPYIHDEAGYVSLIKMLGESYNVKM